MKRIKTCSTCLYFRKRDYVWGWCGKDVPDSVLDTWLRPADEVRECWKPKRRKK